MILKEEVKREEVRREEKKLCKKFPKLEHKYFSLYDFEDGTVTLDADFTIDELKAIVESFERLIKIKEEK